MSSDNSKILVEKNGLTATVTLNRPEKRNSLDEQMIIDLKNAIDKLSEDNETKSIVITGAGENFCSGLYLEYLNKISQYDILQNKEDSLKFKELLCSIYNCKKTTIAKVHGYALAGGCGIATACDIIIASNKSQFGYTEVKIGFIPAIVMVFLLKRVSETYAKDLLLTSRFISGDEALRMGLINFLVKEEELDKAADTLCKELNTLPLSSVMLTKEMFKNVESMSFESGLEYAVGMNAITRMTPECKKGIFNFLNKNK
jgi:methylglutaconyl-CoA hydratase